MKFTAGFIFFLMSTFFTLQAQNGPTDICPIKNSEEVPSAMVINQEGSEIDLKTYIGDRTVVVVFYRGGWCPYCRRHLSALGEIKPLLDSLDFELIAITPDQFSKLEKTSNSVNNLDYKLFSDSELNAINAFGIGWTMTEELYSRYKNKYSLDVESWTGQIHHVLPVPSVFIINRGIIEYQHVNPDYKKRLSPEVLASFLTRG